MTSFLSYSAPELTTQAPVLTRDQTVDLLLCKTTLKPLNHTSQGPGASLVLSFFLFSRCVSREVSSLSSKHTPWLLPHPIAAPSELKWHLFRASFLWSEEHTGMLSKCSFPGLLWSILFPPWRANCPQTKPWAQEV